MTLPDFLNILLAVVYLAGAVVFALLIRDGWQRRTTLEREEFHKDMRAIASERPHLPALVLVLLVVLWPLSFLYALHRRDKRKGA